MRALYARTAAILNDAPDRVLPLGVLRERLRSESLYDGTAPTLLAALQRRPDLFATVQPAPPLADEPGWSDEERRAYLAAFADAGITADVRVALRDPQPGGFEATPATALMDNSLHAVESAVMALWSDRAEHGDLRRDLSSALLEIDRMRSRLTIAAPHRPASAYRTSRTTSPPPDLRRRS